MRSTISRGGHDVVEPPAVRRADVHVLDEPERMARAAEVASHVDDACVVDASLDDGVHLHREPDGVGGLDPLEHTRDGEVDVVHRLERRVVERVEAHVHAVEAGVTQRPSLLREERGVRRQREVEPVDRRELLDEALELLAQQRLTAGQPDLLDAERDECARNALELLE